MRTRGVLSAKHGPAMAPMGPLWHQKRDTARAISKHATDPDLALTWKVANGLLKQLYEDPTGG